ncbi:hypothetical protein [Altererythrobacter sp. MF3-039]|uniref:hypothetical protein n=1 Tax=Altererythrobacter sp. MF3-039 TaxID=3252901 RepID=UPI00390CD7F9
MIEARAKSSGLTARLTDKAEQIARAVTQNRIRRLASDPSRWRTPSLLWPLFTKD